MSKVSSAPPKDSSAPPKESSAPPKDSSSPPKDSSAPPKDSSAPPKYSSSPPKDSSAPPKDSSAPPKDSSSPPKDSSSPPKDFLNVYWLLLCLPGKEETLWRSKENLRSREGFWRINLRCIMCPMANNQNNSDFCFKSAALIYSRFLNLVLDFSLT